MLLPVVNAGKAMMERLVLWSAEQEYIVKKSLVFVTPGVGLDAAAIDLADSIGFDVGTMKVCCPPTAPPSFRCLLALACSPCGSCCCCLSEVRSCSLFGDLLCMHDGVLVLELHCGCCCCCTNVFVGQMTWN